MCSNISVTHLKHLLQLAWCEGWAEGLPDKFMIIAALNGEQDVFPDYIIFWGSLVPQLPSEVPVGEVIKIWNCDLNNL